MHQYETLFDDWSFRKTFLIQHKMLKFYVEQGMVVEKYHEVV